MVRSGAALSPLLSYSRRHGQFMRSVSSGVSSGPSSAKDRSPQSCPQSSLDLPAKGADFRAQERRVAPRTPPLLLPSRASAYS